MYVEGARGKGRLRMRRKGRKRVTLRYYGLNILEGEKYARNRIGVEYCVYVWSCTVNPCLNYGKRSDQGNHERSAEL